jgi:hypothetical protein
MRHRDDPSLSSPLPIFVQRPEAAADIPSLPALERSAYRHSPVTGFEWAMLLAGLAWIITVTFVRWPAPLYPQFGSNSTIDAAFFALAGRMVRAGEVPYVAFWDHKPPLIYLINAFALSLSSGGVWGIWVVTVAAFAATLGLAWRAWRPTVGPTAAIVGMTWVAASVGLVAPFNLTEGYVLPVHAGAMLLMTRWSPLRRRVVVSGLVVGALAGLAFMLRPNFVGAPAVVMAMMVIGLLTTRQPRKLAVWVTGVVVGVALTIAPILVWLGTQNALRPFLEQVFSYNATYVAACRVRGRGDDQHVRNAAPANQWMGARFAAAGRPSARRDANSGAVVRGPLAPRGGRACGGSWPHLHALLRDAPASVRAAHGHRGVRGVRDHCTRRRAGGGGSLAPPHRAGRLWGDRRRSGRPDAHRAPR